MKIEIELSQAGKIRATGEGFDPVSIYLEDISRGDGGVCGKLILESDSDTWCHYWGSMGGGQTIRSFLLKATNEYIAQKLCRGKIWQTDLVKIEKDCGGDPNDPYTYGKLEKFYGEDWVHDLPEMRTLEYKRVMRAVDIMKQAIKMEQSSEYQQAVGRIHRQPATRDDLGGTSVKRRADLEKSMTLAELNYKLLAYDKANSLGHVWIRPLIEYLYNKII